MAYGGSYDIGPGGEIYGGNKPNSAYRPMGAYKTINGKEYQLHRESGTDQTFWVATGKEEKPKEEPKPKPSGGGSSKPSVKKYDPGKPPKSPTDPISKEEIDEITKPAEGWESTKKSKPEIPEETYKPVLVPKPSLPSLVSSKDDDKKKKSLLSV